MSVTSAKDIEVIGLVACVLRRRKMFMQAATLSEALNFFIGFQVAYQLSGKEPFDFPEFGLEIKEKLGEPRVVNALGWTHWVTEYLLKINDEEEKIERLFELLRDFSKRRHTDQI